ncbi:hypothetical protein [Ruania rhizosphaerae]|uniref:phage tail tube protein n=1 Tax=Ruania rhizosphaerae TaxID=1840413 RepID=UPI00135C8F9A|nr:hypothetical protein [Ruania rhizosphaerae]
MPKTLADGRVKLTALTTKPADVAAITITELGAGTEAACSINKSDYRLSATGSTPITEQEMCRKGEGNTPGPTQYEGSVTPFWYLDETGQPDPAAMEVWDLLKTKGTTLWLVERDGPEEDVDWAEGDEYVVYEVVTDEPQVPTDRFTGFIKRIVPLGVQWKETGVVAAGV